MGQVCPDNPEAREPRGDLLCEGEGPDVRYEIRVRLASRHARSQMVIWSYANGTGGIALVPAGADVRKVKRWNP